MRDAEALSPPVAPRLRAAGRWWPLAAPPLAAGLYAGGGIAAQAAVLAAVACALLALYPRLRPALTRASALLAVAALLDLALVLVLDRFDYRYVWLYSHAALPDAYKLANLWGGDEGTLLLLTALAALAAARLVRAPGWAGPAALLLVAALGVGAAQWSPFVELAGADPGAGRGMNAHLVKVWMLVHPPFVFVSYTLFVLPCGAALQALVTGEGAWETLAARWVRFGWLTLSAGLVAGMWWAYEDFTFGQFWHWDPVQTSVFMVWALATAHLHTMRRYRAGGTYGRLNPALGLATAVAALVSLVVTRQPALASSHRYVGDTSFPWLLALAGVLAALSLAAFAASWRRRLAHGRHNEASVLVLIATIALAGCALAAAGVIAEAYVSHALGLPRPEKLKPFFEILARWTSSAEVERLRGLFDQWDIDRYRINALLAPVGIAIGLAGGHNFLPLRRRLRWAVTGAIALAALVAALVWQPMERGFTGSGMTSTNTTAIFAWLDALAVALLYLGLAALAWGGHALRHLPHGHRAVGRHYLPVGALHLGVVVALLAAIVASVFDLYNWRQLRFPDDFEKPIRFPWGYEVTVAVDREALLADGARTDADAGFHAVARVRWSLARDGAVVESADGETVYRDSRPPPPRGLGPIRLMCEILDYRYARTVSGAEQMIDPFIHRGLWRDVQVWLPAVEYRREADAELASLRAPSTVPVVLKIFPMMTWMWIGLAVVWIGAAVAMRFEIARRR